MEISKMKDSCSKRPRATSGNRDQQVIPITNNGNARETKANESFDNGVFFVIEAKRIPSTVSKLFSKLSEHVR